MNNFTKKNIETTFNFIFEKKDPLHKKEFTRFLFASLPNKYYGILEQTITEHPEYADLLIDSADTEIFLQFLLSSLHHSDFLNIAITCSADSSSIMDLFFHIAIEKLLLSTEFDDQTLLLETHLLLKDSEADERLGNNIQHFNVFQKWLYFIKQRFFVSRASSNPLIILLANKWILKHDFFNTLKIVELHTHPTTLILFFIFTALFPCKLQSKEKGSFYILPNVPLKKPTQKHNPTDIDHSINSMCKKNAVLKRYYDHKNGILELIIHYDYIYAPASLTCIKFKDNHQTLDIKFFLGNSYISTCSVCPPRICSLIDDGTERIILGNPSLTLHCSLEHIFTTYADPLAYVNHNVDLYQGSISLYYKMSPSHCNKFLLALHLYNSMSCVRLMQSIFNIPVFSPIFTKKFFMRSLDIYGIKKIIDGIIMQLTTLSEQGIRTINIMEVDSTGAPIFSVIAVELAKTRFNIKVEALVVEFTPRTSSHSQQFINYFNCNDDITVILANAHGFNFIKWCKEKYNCGFNIIIIGETDPLFTEQQIRLAYNLKSLLHHDDGIFIPAEFIIVPAFIPKESLYCVDNYNLSPFDLYRPNKKEQLHETLNGCLLTYALEEYSFCLDTNEQQAIEDKKTIYFKKLINAPTFCFRLCNVYGNTYSGEFSLELSEEIMLTEEFLIQERNNILRELSKFKSNIENFDTLSDSSFVAPWNTEILIDKTQIMKRNFGDEPLSIKVSFPKACLDRYVYTFMPIIIINSIKETTNKIIIFPHQSSFTQNAYIIVGPAIDNSPSKQVTKTIPPIIINSICMPHDIKTPTPQELITTLKPEHFNTSTKTISIMYSPNTYNMHPTDLTTQDAEVTSMPTDLLERTSIVSLFYEMFSRETVEGQINNSDHDLFIRLKDEALRLVLTKT